MLAELDVDAAVAEAELLESVGGAEVGVVLGALPRRGARLEAPEGPLVVERDGGGRGGVAEEARRQVRADLERRGWVLGGGDRDRAGAGAQRQRRRRRAPPHVSGCRDSSSGLPASLSSAARSSERRVTLTHASGPNSLGAGSTFRFVALPTGFVCSRETSVFMYVAVTIQS